MALRTPVGIDVLELDVAKASIVSDGVIAAMVAELLEAGPEEVAGTLTAKGQRLRGLLAERVPGLPLGEPPAPWVPDDGLELAADVVARALRGARRGQQ
jgi:hypothetical protein